MIMDFSNFDKLIALAIECETKKVRYYDSEEIRTYMTTKGYDFVRSVVAFVYMGMRRASNEKMSAVESFEDHKQNLPEEKDIVSEMDHVISKCGFRKMLEKGVKELKAELGV